MHAIERRPLQGINRSKFMYTRLKDNRDERNKMNDLKSYNTKRITQMEWITDKSREKWESCKYRKREQEKKLYPLTRAHTHTKYKDEMNSTNELWNMNVAKSSKIKPKECNNVIVMATIPTTMVSFLRIKYQKNWVYLNWSLRSWQFSLKLKIQPATT